MNAIQGMAATPGIANIALPFNTIASSSITLSVSDIEQGYITVSYTGPNGNDPVAFSNFLYVWRGASAIPWDLQPVASQAAAHGGAAISGNFDAEPYIVGYSVGPSVGTGATATYPSVCATAALPDDWNINEVVYVSPTLAVATVQTNVITYLYHFPDGFDPQANNAWIGLYEGNVTPYSTMPVVTVPITQTTSSGSAPMPGVAIAPRGTYTVALFASGYNTTPSQLSLTTIAATTVFTTEAKLD